MALATFAAGCFWGVEEEFRCRKGVLSTEVGYTGGHTEGPTYEEVCSDRTGHAEAVRIEFDPGEISYEQLLDVFFVMHDPTSRDRQGPDVGSQYRSAIFFHDPEQEAAARRKVEELTRAGKFSRPIVTQIVPAGPFWRAEEHHQKYLASRGLRGCHL